MELHYEFNWRSYEHQYEHRGKIVLKNGSVMNEIKIYKVEEDIQDEQTFKQNLKECNYMFENLETLENHHKVILSNVTFKLKKSVLQIYKSKDFKIKIDLTELKEEKHRHKMYNLQDMLDSILEGIKHSYIDDTDYFLPDTDSINGAIDPRV